MGITAYNTPLKRYMKKIDIIFKFFLAAIFVLSAVSTEAQIVSENGVALMARPADSIIKKYRIAVFAPLYLDSAFTNSAYRYPKDKFPVFVLPGFDFVKGAQMAVQDADLGSIKVEASIYDSKSKNKSILWLARNGMLDSIDLIIGSVKDRDYYELASVAGQMHIPFISATFPNDMGVKKNPFVTVLNSTVQTHCEGIFSYLLGNHGTEKIVFVRKPGSKGDFIGKYFDKMNAPDNNKLLNLQTVNIEADDFSAVISQLDSTKTNMIVGASFDERFCTGLVKALSKVSAVYKCTVIGMPTWDGFDFVINKRDYAKDFPVYFTTPFYHSDWDAVSKKIFNTYKNTYKSNPSDFTFKGYEATAYFLRLLVKYDKDVMNHLNDVQAVVFNNYLIVPQFTDKTSSIPDFFENKRLNFIKAENGVLVKAW